MVVQVSGFADKQPKESLPMKIATLIARILLGLNSPSLA